MNIEFNNYKIEPFNTRQSEELFTLMNSNKSRLEDFFAGLLSYTATLEKTKSYCLEIEQKVKDKTYFPFIIKNKMTGEFVGLVDVKNINWDIPKAELGYLIDSKYEGKGVISTSVGNIVDNLVKTYKFKKLLCRAAANNPGSIKVALKNGFELEGTIRRDYKTAKGELVDLNYYGRIF